MDKNLALIVGGVLAFFLLIMGGIIYQGDTRDATIAGMVTKGVNPIVARCAIDHNYASGMTALCQEALKKETK